MSDLNLTSFNPLYPMRIHQYNELINDQNTNVMDKVNSIIDYLNQVGKLTNDVVKDWNTVYNWVMNEGLTTDVNNKLEAMLANHEFDPIMNTILTKMGDLTTLTTTAKDTIVNAINSLQSDMNTKIGDLTSLQTVDKSSLVHAVNENTTLLAQIVSNKVYLANYPRNAGETNDNGAFTRAFAAITDNTEVIFEKGKTYTITQGFSIKNNNVILNGNGCTIQSTTTSATTLFSTYGNNYKTVNNANVSFGQKASAITLPDVNGISVGDFILAYNSVANSGGYNTGIYSVITSIDTTNKIIYIAHPSNTAFTADRINFYTPYLNIKICGFNINCTQYDIGIWLQYAKNSKVYNNVITSNGARVGVNNNYSINCVVEDNYISGFRDDLNIDNKSGYGIHLGGHNVIAQHNIIKDCKHCISAGEGLHDCSQIKYRDNEAYAGTLSNHLLDFHNNCAGEMDNNYVYALTNTAGIVVRCSNAVIKNNKIYNDINSTATFKAIIIGVTSTESPSMDNINVIGNEVYGKVGELIEFTTGITFTNVKIKDNISDNGYINVIGSITTALIEKNHIKQNCQIILPNNAKDILINKNILAGGDTEYDNIIAIGTGSVDIRIMDNIFTHQSINGGMCIRTSSPYIQIEHNSFICDSSHLFYDVNTYFNHIIKDNVQYSLDYLTVTKWSPYDNSGTASILASGTSVVVNHGLATTPTKIGATAQGNIGNVWVSNFTATQFTINCATAPVSATAVSWSASV